MKRIKMIRLLMLIIGSASALIFAGQSAQAGADVARKVTVMTFPFAVSSNIKSEKAVLASKCAVGLNELVFSSLSELSRLTAVRFNPANISIRRAVLERSLNPAEIASPLDTTLYGEKTAAKCGRIVGADYVIIGSLDKYDYLSDIRRLEIGATLQLIEVSTGKVKNTASATSRSLHLPDDDGSEEALCATAVRRAFDKLIVDFIPSDIAKK